MNAPERLPAAAVSRLDPAAAEPHVMKTYGRLPIALAHGEGCWLWDTEGNKYLDGLAGIAVNTLGHNHPKLVPALHDQVSKIIHSSNYYLVPLQEQLAGRLCELSGLTNVFFCNSGLEANAADDNVFAFCRRSKDSDRLIAFAMNLAPVPRYDYRIGLPRSGTWRETLNTDAQYYGGSGVGNLGGVEAGGPAWGGQPFSAGITLPPLGGIWLVPEAQIDAGPSSPAARPD